MRRGEGRLLLPYTARSRRCRDRESLVTNERGTVALMGFLLKVAIGAPMGS